MGQIAMNLKQQGSPFAPPAIDEHGNDKFITIVVKGLLTYAHEEKLESRPGFRAVSLVALTFNEDSDSSLPSSTYSVATE